MTAPAVPVAIPRVSRPSVRPRVDRATTLVETWLRLHSALVYVFLYAPILVVVLYAFNDTRGASSRFEGFSLHWFDIAINDPVVIQALTNSFIVAIPNAILATLFGTMAALGLQRVGVKLRTSFDALTYVSVIVPEIVIALSTLVLFRTAFDAYQDVTGGRLQFGYATIIASHVLFNTSLVLLLVRARLSGMDRTLVEASADLFASPWRTFRQITFPQLLPAIVAGFLLSFTFSFDDFVITTFVSGPGSSTLPIFIWGQTKRGVTPETNAIAVMILAFTIGMLFLGQLALTWQSRRRGRQGGGMGEIIAQQQGG